MSLLMLVSLKLSRLFVSNFLTLYLQYSGEHVMLASKWFNGLIEKDIQTSNEVYSIDTVDFDRQVR